MKKMLLLMLIFISTNVSAQIFIPNAFTPNNDGRNDIFKVVNITTEKITELNIFNRWGILIYHSQNNSGWDGTYNNILQSTGVYLYYITYSNNDSIFIMRGNVTLIR
jgi:gliding motility-associated-like protein